MKKFLALLIAVMMVFTLATMAMAEDEGGLLTAPAQGEEAGPDEDIGGEVPGSPLVTLPVKTDPLCIRDGYIVGTVVYDGFIEVIVNAEGVGAGIGSVEVKYPEFNNANIASIYVDGRLVDEFIIGAVQDPDPTEPPVDPTEPPVDPTEPPVDPTEPPVQPVSVKIAEDGKTAQVTGDFEGLYARIALVLDMDGVSGLIVQQGVINPTGEIVIPAFDLKGLEVTGISVAITGDQETLLTPMPQDVIAHDFLKL